MACSRLEKRGQGPAGALEVICVYEIKYEVTFKYLIQIFDTKCVVFTSLQVQMRYQCLQLVFLQLEGLDETR